MSEDQPVRPGEDDELVHEKETVREISGNWRRSQLKKKLMSTLLLCPPPVLVVLGALISLLDWSSRVLKFL